MINGNCLGIRPLNKIEGRDFREFRKLSSNFDSSIDFCSKPWAPVGRWTLSGEVKDWKKMLDEQVKQGESLVNQLPKDFISDNFGKFMAISYEGKIIAIADSLDKLLDDVEARKIKGNLYVARIGYDAVAEI